MVTAYDYSIACLLEETRINAILVGDSLGMVMLGYENTLSVTLDDMVHHTRAVSRGTKSPLLVADLPFLSYHTGVADCVKNAGRLIQEGHAEAVKLEGGVEFTNEIKALVRASIPVMGHLGLTPQSVHAFGGFKVQGKTIEQAQKVLDAARSLQDAGVFSIVLEGIPQSLGAKITAELEVPIIGIGAGVCDGQVLVWQDMLGISKRTPKFVKRFANLSVEIVAAVNDFAAAVEEGSFPKPEHCYSVENEAEIMSHLH